MLWPVRVLCCMLWRHSGIPIQCALCAVQAYTQLRGDAPLPWEGERLTDAVRAKLGVLRSPILETLNRDPAARPPCSVFCDRLRAAFSADSSSLRHS